MEEFKINQYTENIELKIGEKYGDYVITGITKKKNETRKYYVVKCSVCGREKEKARKDLIKENGVSHQSCSSLLEWDEKFYIRYQSMRTRTTNKNNPSWEYYKNISSDYYKYYVDFYDDMHESYLKHLEKYGYSNTTLDRIDPTKDYCFDNIRWATKAEQNNNTRKHQRKFLAHNIETNEIMYFSNQTEFAEYINVGKTSVNRVIFGHRKTIKNWEIKEIFEA